MLEYRAGLRPGGATSLPEGRLLMGSFAHAILESMLFGPDKLALDRDTPADAEVWATTAFDRRVGSEAAILTLTGHALEREQARTLIGKAAAALVRIIRDSQLTLVATEREATGKLEGQELHGYLDLELARGDQPYILDLKLGRGRRRAQLAEGRALQLAIYSRLRRTAGGREPIAGFLVLEDQELLTTAPGAFAHATEVEGPSMSEVFERTAAGFRYWRNVLAAGVVPRTKPDVDWQEIVTSVAGEPPSEGPAAPEPGCGYCNYGRICNATVGRV
jgi:hypothetical protein